MNFRCHKVELCNLYTAFTFSLNTHFHNLDIDNMNWLLFDYNLMSFISESLTFAAMGIDSTWRCVSLETGKTTERLSAEYSPLMNMLNVTAVVPQVVPVTSVLPPGFIRLHKYLTARKRQQLTRKVLFGVTEPFWQQDMWEVDFLPAASHSVPQPLQRG